MTTRLILILLSSLWFPSAAFAQDKPQDKFQTSRSFKRKVTKTIRADYLLFLPKEYDAKAAKRWPLILFLHGAGERGTNVWRVDIHGPAKYIGGHPDFPFILVSPLCPTNETWSNEVVLELLDKVCHKHKVDRGRIYLTGLSMGGFGTWSLALNHPEKFAAVAPICGGGDALPLRLARHGYLAPEKTKALKTLPVWAFHGAKDSVVPIVESERLVEELKAIGVGEIKFTAYPDLQHNSWERTYNDPQLYSWFLEHRREAAR